MADRSISEGRGRGARSPRDIPGSGWRDILVRTWRAIGADHVSVVAAGVAFFGLLALFPAIAAFVSMAGFFIDPQQMQEQVSTYTEALPPEAAEIVNRQAEQVASSDSAAGWGAALGFLLALWGASKGVKTLMEGMNIAYAEEEKRNFLVFNLVALALTLFLIFGLVVAVGAAVVAPALASFMSFPPWIAGVMTYAPWPLLLVLTIVGLAVIYRYGPSRETAEWRWLTPGAVVATVIWLIGSVGLSVYVSNFGSYNATYGALGGVIVLLLWLWLSSFAVLLGAELNAEIEHQTRTDTTTGAPRPMGARGAEKADTPGRTP
jgi:membrane protein